MFALSEAAWERYDPLSLEFELLQRTVSEWRQHARDRAEDAREVQREGAAFRHRYLNIQALHLKPAGHTHGYTVWQG